CCFSLLVLPLGAERGAASRNASEGGAGHETGAGGIVVVEQAADHLPAGKEAGERTPVGSDDFGLLCDLEAAEGKRNAAGCTVGVVRGLVDLDGPVGLPRRQAATVQSIFTRRIETFGRVARRLVVFGERLERL